MEFNDLDWQAMPLKELFVHVIGGDWGKDEDFGEEDFVNVSCIRGSEFKNWKSNFGSTAVTRKIKSSSLVTRKLVLGDILIEISGGGPEQPVGRTVLITEKVLNNLPYPPVCTNFLRLARPSQHVNSAYLNYFLAKFYMSGEVVNYQGGSNNLRNLKFKEYETIEVPLPPLAEQKVIADKLDTLLAQVDNTKARLERIPEILKIFRQSVLAAAVTGKLTNILGEQKKLVAIVKFKQGTQVPSEEQVDSELDGYERFLRIINFTQSSKDFKYVKKDDSNRRITETDIVMVRYGATSGLVGRGLNGILANNLFVISPDETKLSKDYLYYFLKSPDFQSSINQMVKGGAMPAISFKLFDELKIYIPSLEEQTEIVRRVEELFAFADRIEQATQAAQSRVNNLAQSILAKAFRGELTADWRAANPDLISGDNSAKALLDKIKTERATFGKAKVKK